VHSNGPTGLAIAMMNEYSRLVVTLQMTASDHAQQRSQRFPLPERGRPQMESRHSLKQPE
jgi:hypothetical protein